MGKLPSPPPKAVAVDGSPLASCKGAAGDCTSEVLSYLGACLSVAGPFLAPTIWRCLCRLHYTHSSSCFRTIPTLEAIRKGMSNPAAVQALRDLEGFEITAGIVADILLKEGETE